MADGVIVALDLGSWRDTYRARVGRSVTGHCRACRWTADWYVSFCLHLSCLFIHGDWLSTINYRFPRKGSRELCSGGA